MATLKVDIPGEGTLALVGAGEYLDPMAPVDRFLISQLHEIPRVVCLPTAAGSEGEQRVQYWTDLGVKHFQDLGVEQVEGLRMIDRAGAENAEMAARIRQANFIYFSGGKPAYLYRSLVGTLAWKAILDVLAGGGVVAGCSAGAMIFGERVISGPGRLDPFEGFGWLKGAYVIPHFDELPAAMVEGAALLLRKWTLVGVDGFTALIAGEHGLCVRGRGKVEVRTKGARSRYTEADGWWQLPA